LEHVLNRPGCFEPKRQNGIFEMDMETFQVGQTISALLERSPQWACAQIQSEPKIIPAVGGVYAWWFEALDGVRMDGAAQRNGRSLLYVGIAPRRPARGAQTGNGNLRDRLRDHCHGPSRSSTLRRSLAAVLRAKLSLEFQRDANGKIRLAGDGEGRLSTWMASNACVSWVETLAPWEAEEALLRSANAPPLNIAGKAGLYGEQLREMRKFSAR
jgi:hypothetical protein